MAPTGRAHGVQVGPAGILTVAMVGAWLSHNLEYLRLGGTQRFAAVAWRSVHLYIGPVGGLLLLAGLVGVQSTTRLARRLEHRLADLGRHPPGHSSAPASANPGRPFANPTLVMVVWFLQVGLYLVQENTEAVLSHRPPLGMAALTGDHALAPLIHVAVTLALVAVVCLLRRRVTRLAASLRAVAAGLRARRPASIAPPASSKRYWTPVQRWGSHLWCRPPPLAVGS